MKLLKSLVLLTSLAASLSVFAHGEDKTGPNGGFIRMPGAFHTELVLQGKNKVKVYLLDIRWKNPSVAKSSLEVTLSDNLKADCKVHINYYLCSFPKSVDLTKKGQLKVLAVRNEQKGIEVLYPTPLKLEISEDGHDGHH